MRCSTCGENYSDDAPRCPTCGAGNSRAVSLPPDPIRRCPRCGHRGDGISYFRRPGHIALLVVFSLFTYGIGGLIYWLVKREHSICPNCGLDWQTLPLTGVEKRPQLASGTPRGREGVPPSPRLPRSGIFRRILGVGATLASVGLVAFGIVDMEVGAIVTGSLMAGGGSLTYWWGWTALQNRRQALLTGLQRQVLMLATQKSGSLTVTEVATDLSLSIPMAEKVMMSMDDGFRVRSEVTDDGLILYEFPELRRRHDAAPRIEPGTSFPG